LVSVSNQLKKEKEGLQSEVDRLAPEKQTLATSINALKNTDESLRTSIPRNKQQLDRLNTELNSKRLELEELQHYVRVFRPKLCSHYSCYLFPRSDGYHISVNSVQQFIRRIAIKAGLQGMKCCPHIFRYTFATTFIAKGGTDFALKEILGHTSLQPTLKYTHLQPRDLQRQHARSTPVEDLFQGEQ